MSNHFYAEKAERGNHSATQIEMGSDWLESYLCLPLMPAEHSPEPD